MKILSIIIPAYNMEQFVAGCLNSILRTQSLAEVEIIIVNDGSRDGTLRIANSYAGRYADSIRVIDKSNGNYGSTVNAALPLARGKYVRILDADDLFDGGRIGDYIAELKRVEGADMVISPFMEVRGKSLRRIGYNIYSRKRYKTGVLYDAEQIFAEGEIRFFMMHGICYRTDLLREMHYRQSEGISYTDQEWVFYPLFRLRKIAFTDVALYHYTLGREGQTMAPDVQMRSLAQLVAVTENMADFFIRNKGKRLQPARSQFLRGVLVSRFRILYRKYLLEMPARQFERSDFRSVDGRLDALAARCGIKQLEVPVNNLFRVDLLARWRRRGRRYSPFTLWVLRGIDALMVRVHALIFR